MSAITLTFALRTDAEDEDDIAETIAELARQRYPVAIKSIEHHDRDMPRTYGFLYGDEDEDEDDDDDE